MPRTYNVQEKDEHWFLRPSSTHASLVLFQGCGVLDGQGAPWAGADAWISPVGVEEWVALDTEGVRSTFSRAGFLHRDQTGETWTAYQSEYHAGGITYMSCFPLTYLKHVIHDFAFVELIPRVA